MNSGWNRFHITWLVLVLATCLTAVFAEGAYAVHIAVPMILIIALFKARLVFLYFMELKDAPLAWRLVLESWGILVTGIILGGYVLTL